MMIPSKIQITPTHCHAVIVSFKIIADIMTATGNSEAERMVPKLGPTTGIPKENNNGGNNTPKKPNNNP